ncbi:uncharacterized protein DS421_17g588900 [Arachis hypogaea]|nr:uncharacterized protein DS421_17g588900 [Arachis hypogaea]
MLDGDDYGSLRSSGDGGLVAAKRDDNEASSPSSASLFSPGDGTPRRHRKRRQGRRQLQRRLLERQIGGMSSGGSGCDKDDAVAAG